MGGAVELEVVVGLFCALRVARAEDEPVRLGLGQELLYELEPLREISVHALEGGLEASRVLHWCRGARPGINSPGRRRRPWPRLSLLRELPCR